MKRVMSRYPLPDLILHSMTSNERSGLNPLLNLHVSDVIKLLLDGSTNTLAAIMLAEKRW